MGSSVRAAVPGAGAVTFVVIVDFLGFLSRAARTAAARSRIAQCIQAIISAERRRAQPTAARGRGTTRTNTDENEHNGRTVERSRPYRAGVRVNWAYMPRGFETGRRDLALARMRQRGRDQDGGVPVGPASSRARSRRSATASCGAQ